MNILILDDDKMIHHYLESILKNHSSFHCYSIKEAKELLKKEHFELALIDYHLSEEDKGLDLLPFLHKLTSSCLMTANSSEDILVKAFKQKTSFLLKKPFTKNQLKKVIDQAEEKHKATIHSQILLHELMSPLFALQGTIDINKIKESKNKTLDYKNEYNKVISQIQNMLNLVHYFNKHSNNNKNINLKNLFKEIKNDCSLMTERSFYTNQIEIKTDDIILENINETILKHSLINLIKNSYDSNHECKITSSTKLIESNIVISIKDTGSGIPKEKQSKIFIPNYTSKDFGMGIGLFFSKESLKDLGIELSLKQSNSKGTEFEMIMPIEFLTKEPSF